MFRGKISSALFHAVRLCLAAIHALELAVSATPKICTTNRSSSTQPARRHAGESMELAITIAIAYATMVQIAVCVKRHVK